MPASIHKIVCSLALCGALSACPGPAPGQPEQDLAAVSPEDLTMQPVIDMPSRIDDLASATMMSFFITSEKGSANLGGLSGADARCQRLATAAGHGQKKWAAYLSAYAANGAAAVNARDRIGTGPWYGAKGGLIADNLTNLHDQQNVMTITRGKGLDEKGVAVPGIGDTPNEHDILTGSTAAGMVNGMATCVNWTSDAAANVNAAVGHFDRDGGGANRTSWNFAHNSSGCSAAALVSTAGAGRFYCFATN